MSNWHDCEWKWDGKRGKKKLRLRLFFFGPLFQTRSGTGADIGERMFRRSSAGFSSGTLSCRRAMLKTKHSILHVRHRMPHEQPKPCPNKKIFEYQYTAIVLCMGQATYTAVPALRPKRRLERAGEQSGHTGSWHSFANIRSSTGPGLRTARRKKISASVIFFWGACRESPRESMVPPIPMR